MPDTFGDELERLDALFTDLDIAGSPRNRLTAILGRAPSSAQVQAAAAKLTPQEQEAERLGFRGERRLLRVGVELQLTPTLVEIVTGRVVRLGIERIREFLRERGAQGI